MSDNKPGINLTEEQLQQIAGGECTPLQVIEILDRLKASYESLVELTSHVIERVAGLSAPQPIGPP